MPARTTSAGRRGAWFCCTWTALSRRGDPVESAGRTVGWVGTPAYHAELGPIALAIIKRNTPDDAPLTAGGIAAAIDPD